MALGKMRSPSYENSIYSSTKVHRKSTYSGILNSDKYRVYIIISQVSWEKKSLLYYFI